MTLGTVPEVPKNVILSCMFLINRQHIKHFMELAINPSKIISPLCYSVLRLEPYTNCSFGCKFCYARWYRRGRIAPRYKALGMFEKVAKKLERRIPFRLATLSEPLQDMEEKYRVSLKIMKVALKYEVPIVLCTKSDRIAKDPWNSIINELGDRGLVIVQVSISSLTNTELEPKAPSPERRLEALKSVDAPKVLRLQPLIPNYSFRNAEDFVSEVAGFVDTITVEPLRVERSELKFYSKFWNRWNDYSFKGDVVKVDAPEILRELKEACDKHSLSFGLCKEGMFDLETGNCCGFDMIDVELRPTLRELYAELACRGAIGLDEVPEIFSEYLFGEKLFDLPRQVRRALKYHERVLTRVLRDPKALAHLTPLIRHENGKLVLSKAL